MANDTFTARVVWGSSLLRLSRESDTSVANLLQIRSTYAGLSISETGISWLMRMAASGYGVEELALVVPEIEHVWKHFKGYPGNRYQEVMEYIYDM
jgi:hypothetical protein